MTTKLVMEMKNEAVKTSDNYKSESGALPPPFIGALQARQEGKQEQPGDIISSNAIERHLGKSVNRFHCPTQR